MVITVLFLQTLDYDLETAWVWRISHCVLWPHYPSSRVVCSVRKVRLVSSFWMIIHDTFSNNNVWNKFCSKLLILGVLGLPSLWGLLLPGMFLLLALRLTSGRNPTCFGSKRSLDTPKQSGSIASAAPCGSSSKTVEQRCLIAGKEMRLHKSCL